MAPLSSPALTAAAALLVAAASSSEAFVSPSCPSRSAFGLQTAAVATPVSPRLPSFSLRAEENEAAEAEAAGASEEDEPSAEASEEGEGDAEEPEEDPEVTEIKAKIAELEAEIKAKKSSLDQVKESIDRYTEGGYLRKVAEMDQIRKMRGVSPSLPSCRFYFD
uniref:Uncharacterized protein n=1 Tax=Odontella aurita TaxID=265563 RepID=A0A7S4JV35_9STRA|mmetsp:Transcript_54189/g.162254  ORF Transcript_54189/g.162254 Transcript_54189/m.162254 type:complete len:164 (+) Transcript_54189:163-654(+)